MERTQYIHFLDLIHWTAVYALERIDGIDHFEKRNVLGFLMQREPALGTALRHHQVASAELL